MYFSGGMIPTYLQIRGLGLLNSPLVLIVGAGVSCWNLIVTRTYFANSIPEELYESADIDGATEFQAFFAIALPLAKPILAVMALFYGVGHWNSYYGALLYVRSSRYFPLQLVLRNIVIQGSDTDMLNFAGTATETASTIVTQNYKYASIVVAVLPILAVYPFVQRFFVKGVMIGSLKG